MAPSSRAPMVPTLTVDLSGNGHSARSRWSRLVSGAAVLPRWAGIAGTLTIIALAIGGGLLAGGQYESFRERNGSIADILARNAGFGIREIAIAGNKELTPAEVIAATGITGANSLPFLSAATIQERLKAVSLIGSVSVRKLFPDKLVLIITERLPFGLWQIDGNVHLVAADGTVIDEMRDQRFLRLPFVVGPGANKRVTEFAEILDTVPDFRERIRAGTLISERRWNLKLTSGIDVKLPEAHPAEALKALVRLDQDFNVLAKDILSIDLRVPGRVAFRLSEDAARARAEMMDKKTAKKGKA